MPGCFISYRREDSSGHAGRLFDHLAQRLGRGSVFMDVAGIDPGVDFVDAIDRAVGSCDVLIVVIGREWLSCTDASGRRRLDDPGDFIRLEVGTALRRSVRVIPVLVEGATMPRADALPQDLQLLARRQAIELSDTRWESDLDRLIESLRAISPPPTPRKARWTLLAVAASVLVATAVTSAWFVVRWRHQETQIKMVSVPPLIGLSFDKARQLLQAKGLLLGNSSDKVTTASAAGTIIESRPVEGERIKLGGRVDLVLATRAAVKDKTAITKSTDPVVTTRPAEVVVPAVSGLMQADAEQNLINAGLSLGKRGAETTGKAKPGAVLWTIPPAGSKVALKTPVNLIIEADERQEGRQPARIAVRGNLGFGASTQIDLDSEITRSARVRRADVDLVFTVRGPLVGTLEPANGAVLAPSSEKPDYNGCTRTKMQQTRLPFDVRRSGIWVCARTNRGRYSVVGVSQSPSSTNLLVDYVTYEPQRLAEPIRTIPRDPSQ